jgi:hypothetical protein
MGFEVFIFVSNGDIPSFGTPEILELNFRGQTPCLEMFFIPLERS